MELLNILNISGYVSLAMIVIVYVFLFFNLNSKNGIKVVIISQSLASLILLLTRFLNDYKIINTLEQRSLNLLSFLLVLVAGIRSLRLGHKL